MDKEILEFLKEFKEEFKILNTKLDENTQILRALEHSAQVNKAEHDKMGVFAYPPEKVS